MKKILLPIFLCFSLHAFAQIKYEPGYIITNDGRRMDVLLLNKEWRDNPTTFSYKITPSGETVTAGIEDVQEFGAGDYLKFKRVQTGIDRSADQISNMSTQSAPEFETQTVFLEQLVEGEADLYSYREGTLDRFFIYTPAAGFQPLVYKEYLQGNAVATNNRFRQQLLEIASCGENSSAEIRKTDYRKKDLIDFFIGYNKCRRAEYHVFEEEGAGLQVNFTLKGGLDFARLAIESGLYVSGNEIELEPSLRLGAEMEAVLPFNRNKWSIFLEPTYTSLNVEKEHFVARSVYDTHEVDLTIDFQYLTIATGIRHYFFLDEASKIFVSAGVSFDVNMKTYILIDRDERYQLDPELEKVQNDAYLNLGLGYNYRGLSAEIRYNSPKTIIGSNSVPTHYFLDWKSQVNSFSILLGYTLF